MVCASTCRPNKVVTETQKISQQLFNFANSYEVFREKRCRRFSTKLKFVAKVVPKLYMKCKLFILNSSQ